MSRFDRITISPGMMGGQPTIRGMRLTVYRVIAILAGYPNRTELLKEYPDLEEEDLDQALEFVEACMIRLSSTNIFSEVQVKVDDNLGDWNEKVGAFIKVEPYPLPSK
jgi:uncharacterized protein (DUF433 family)